MLVLPALAGFVALLQQILEGAALGALFGAFFGGAISGGGEVVTEIQVHGEINQEVIENVAERTVEGAIDGAVVGVVTGGVFGFAGAAFNPIFAMIDDFFRSIFGALDDAARGIASAADDAFTGIKNAAKSVANGIRALINRTRSGWNARNYANLSKGAGNKGYVYLMDDVSTSGRYKIGKTTRPVERLSEVQSKTGLKLDYSCIIGTDDMKTLEKALFEEFKRQRRRNLVPGTTEIFILNAAQVASACSK